MGQYYLVGGADHDGFLPGVILALLQLLLPALLVLLVHQTGGAPQVPSLHGGFVKSGKKMNNSQVSISESSYLASSDLAFLAGGGDEELLFSPFWTLLAVSGSDSASSSSSTSGTA